MEAEREQYPENDSGNSEGHQQSDKTPVNQPGLMIAVRGTELAEKLDHNRADNRILGIEFRTHQQDRHPKNTSA